MILTNFRKNFLIYAFICLVVMLLFFFGYKCYAVYYTDIDNSAFCNYPYDCSNVGGDKFLQTFKPTKNKISGFSHYGTGWNAKIMVCAGANDCNTVNKLYSATTSPVFDGDRSFYYFDKEYSLSIGTTYTLQMEAPDMVMTYTDITNPYANGIFCRFAEGEWNCFSNNYDMNFTTIYGTPNPPDWVEITSPTDSLIVENFNTTFSASFTLSTTTLADYDKIGIIFTDQASTTGQGTEIIREIYGETDLMNSEDTYIYSEDVNIPHYGNHLTYSAIAGINNGESDWHIIKISESVSWIMKEAWTILDDDICYGVATTTIMGGIECAFKKVVYWALYPSQNSVNNIENSYENIRSSFPFNAFFELTDTIDMAISSTSIDTSGGFSVPLITSTGTIYMKKIISSSTVGQVVGETNALNIRNSISWFMWIATAFLIFLTFKKI